MKHLNFDIMKMGSFIFNITRYEIEEMDFRGIDRLMEMFEKDRSMYIENIEILFDGYNEDERELIEIAEVRSFCKMLLKKYPHILFYIKSEDSIANILSCAQNFDKLSDKGDRFQMKINLDKDLMSYVISSAMEYVKMVTKDKNKPYEMANKITDSIGLNRIPFKKI